MQQLGPPPAARASPSSTKNATTVRLYRPVPPRLSEPRWGAAPRRAVDLSGADVIADGGAFGDDPAAAITERPDRQQHGLEALEVALDALFDNAARTGFDDVAPKRSWMAFQRQMRGSRQPIAPHAVFHQPSR